jgi:hypothetical protein
MSYKEILNASTLFLLQGIGLDVKELNRYGFISAFIDDINHNIKYESSVFLLFQPHELEDLQQFIRKEYKRTELIREDYDYEDGYTVLAYSFPSKFFPDYEKFLMGEYSKFSDEYKNLFPKYEVITDDKNIPKKTYSLYYHVFTKSNAFKKYFEDKLGVALDEDQEVWSSPDLVKKDKLDIEFVKNFKNIK